MNILKKGTQEVIYRLKNDNGGLIEKFARWQAEYTGCEYEDIYNDTFSMLMMARYIYCEFLEASTKWTRAQEFQNLACTTDKIVQNKLLYENVKVDYYEATLLGILQRLFSVQVREKNADHTYRYINGFTNYIEELEKKEE